MYVLNAIGSDLERQAHTANQSVKLVLALFGFHTNDNLLPDLLIDKWCLFHESHRKTALNNLNLQ